MSTNGYKKYMKKDVKQDSPLIKIFVVSFFGMLLVFTFLFKSFSPSVDVTIGDASTEKIENQEELEEKNVDNRLSMIQSEDREKDFSSLMSNATDEVKVDNSQSLNMDKVTNAEVKVEQKPVTPSVYKVYIGNYTSSEQAKVAKDIIIESGNGLNPIVKSLGVNNYTLQVGIFKNKSSAESLMNTIQQNHLPGRIVQE